eukprot:Seg2049.2 transcript_id=Seg2049.2/GoldUCD/mRNA.D3Y31 product="hypothetical protein" protein_id=Seg2049.2/GoldUCD/D3Y31
MIKHKEYHVSLDNRTNRLYLSKQDPPLILYKHFDGMLKNEKGDKCVGMGDEDGIYLSDGCFRPHKYSNISATYTMTKGLTLCWKRIGTEMIYVICGPIYYGFIEVLISDATPTPSLPSTPASPKKSIPTPTTNHSAMEQTPTPSSALSSPASVANFISHIQLPPYQPSTNQVF